MRHEGTEQRSNGDSVTSGSAPELRLAPAGDTARAGGLWARVADAISTHLATWWPVWLVFAASRLGVLAVGMLSQYAAGARSLPAVPFLEAGTFPHYADVVVHGYTAQNAYEYPLLPALMWLLGQAGVPLTVASFVIVNVAFLIGLLGFAAVGAHYVGRAAAVRAAILLAIFPTAYVFSLASTESVMLAGLSLAALFALRGQWLLAAPFAAACALTRPPAIFVAIVLAGIAVSQWRRGNLPLLRAGVALGAAPAAVVGFFTYLHFTTGDFLQAVHSQEQFGRSLSITGPLTAALDAVKGALAAPPVLGPVVELVAALVLVAALAWFWKTARGDRWQVAGWVAFGAASLLLPLATGSVWQIPRFALLVLPAFWLLGSVARRSWVMQACMVLFPMALAVKLVFEVVGVTR